MQYHVFISTGDVSPPPSTVVGHTKTLAKVTFNPSVVEQTRIARNGILGDFIIRYDVNRELSVGDVQVPYIRFVFSILLTIPEIVLHAPHVLEHEVKPPSEGYLSIL